MKILLKFRTILKSPEEEVNVDSAKCAWVFKEATESADETETNFVYLIEILFSQIVVSP